MHTGFIGDYFGLPASRLVFCPFWTNTRAGIEEMFTAQVGKIDAEIAPPCPIALTQETIGTSLMRGSSAQTAW